MPHGVDDDFTALPCSALADAALDRARALGASHADLRVERVREQVVRLRDGRLDGTNDGEDVGLAVRVVSMPSTDVFDRQDLAWRTFVLPGGLPRVAVEAGVTALWHKYVGLDGAVVGIDTFGESAPAGVLFKHFGLTAEKVVQAVRQVL